MQCLQLLARRLIHLHASLSLYWPSVYSTKKPYISKVRTTRLPGTGDTRLKHTALQALPLPAGEFTQREG